MDIFIYKTTIIIYLIKISFKDAILLIQVKSATWALDHGVAVVIGNGMADNCIANIVEGKKLGTFFTNAEIKGTPVELQASGGK